MTELKKCPFCGGEVAIAETSHDSELWMFVTRGHGDNKCKCRIFMESRTYTLDSSESERQKIKKALIEAWNKRYKEDWKWTKNVTALYSDKTTLKQFLHSKIKKNLNFTMQFVDTFLKKTNRLLIQKKQNLVSF